jgi:hypothetical protein
MKKILGILALAFSINAFADCTPLVKHDDTCAIKVFMPMLHCKNTGEQIQIPVTTMDIKNPEALQNAIIAECNAYFATTKDPRRVPAGYDNQSIVTFKLTK